MAIKKTCVFMTFSEFKEETGLKRSDLELHINDEVILDGEIVRLPKRGRKGLYWKVNAVLPADMKGLDIYIQC